MRSTLWKHRTAFPLRHGAVTAAAPIVWIAVIVDVAILPLALLRWSVMVAIGGRGDAETAPAVDEVCATEGDGKGG